MTGFSRQVRYTIMSRGDGWCERCGGDRGVEAHHRRPRGMGGTQRPETNAVSAGLWLCRKCHHRIETQRAEAYEHGWLVKQTQEPVDVPVLYRGSWIRLDDLGNLHPAEGAA